jgi:uncharacterized protein (DUF1778 family)
LLGRALQTLTVAMPKRLAGQGEFISSDLRFRRRTMCVAMRTARMNLRLAEEADERIRRAAAVTGVSTSAFVERAASDAADAVLADRREFVLDPAGWDRFVAELDRPARDLPELRGGRELRDRLTGT